MTYEYQLAQLNNRIAETLSGNGDFETLQSLRREKSELLDKQHFEQIKAVRDEIDALEREQVTIREEINRLEADKRELALDVEVAALRTQQIKEKHGEASSRAYLKEIEFDDNRKAIITLRNNLESLIKTKIEETV